MMRIDKRRALMPQIQVHRILRNFRFGLGYTMSPCCWHHHHHPHIYVSSSTPCRSVSPFSFPFISPTHPVPVLLLLLTSSPYRPRLRGFKLIESEYSRRDLDHLISGVTSVCIRARCPRECSAIPLHGRRRSGQGEWVRMPMR
jgi:hypothetical protein